MSWDNLKTAIANVIKTNGNQEITGYLLQQELFRIVDQLGTSFGYLGVAIPTMNPGPQDGPVYFIATEMGTYVEFNNIEISTNGIYAIKYNGSEWILEIIYRPSFGNCSKTNVVATDLISANQYYAIAGIFSDNGLNQDFTTNQDGSIRYTGKHKKVLFTGVSDVSVDSVTEITYGLFKNGQLLQGAETPHTFSNQNKTETLAITAILEINENDTFQVYAKANSNNVELTPNTLTINFTE